MAGRRSKADKEQEILAELKKRYEIAAGAEAENRRLFSEDLRFVYQDTYDSDGQWDSAVLLMRRGRPSYTFNRVIGAVNLVLGDQRQTRPSVRIRASNKDASTETAAIYGGLVRDIEHCSGAESIYDSQFKNAVAGGYGAWRIIPEFEDDKSFNQVLRIKDIPNPLTVLWDPESTCPNKSDSMWCIVAERISKDKYKSLYPDFDPDSLAMSRDSRGWSTEQEVRIAEYFKKVPVTKTIAELEDGRVVDYDADYKQIMQQLAETHPDGNYTKIKRTRQVKTWAVEWYLCDGANVLQGPIVYKWKRIPVVRVPGRCVNIEGKQKVQSLIRHTKDPQRTYNYHRSTMVELAALTPRAPYIGTSKMFKGYEQMWATANTNARPYLVYDPDPDVPGERPTREPPPDVPQAYLSLSQLDLGDIQAATGYFSASLGDTSDDGGDRTSGKALIARQRKSDLGSYEFIDNFGKALKVSTECLIDMIPTVYDTERVIRVIGSDGVEKYEQINKVTPNGVMNSLKEGSYDCSVTIGPSYQTARQEMLATMLDAVGVMPQIAQVAPDLIMKNIDSPDTDELVRRLRIPLIQQGVIQPTPEESKKLPPAPQPNPEQQLELAHLQAKVRKANASAITAESQANAAPLETQKLQETIEHTRVDSALKAHQLASGAGREQVEALQSLHHSRQDHEQDQRHEEEAHRAELARLAIEHSLNLRHTREEHNQGLRHKEELHKAKKEQVKTNGTGK